MTIDFQLHRKVMLAHYLRLVKVPGWRDYVWNRISDLAKADPGLYGDMLLQVFPETKTAPTQRRGR